MSTVQDNRRPVAGRIHDDPVTKLVIKSIRMDGATQTRVELAEATIAAYAEAMGEGTEFPPVTVFYDGVNYWLADGFHRVKAAIRAGSRKIAADIHQGEHRDAVSYSCGANADHGLPRSNADKRKAVLTLLDDPEWSQLSNREVARRVGVTHTFVGEIKWEREGRPRDPATKRRSDGLPDVPDVEAPSTYGDEKSGSGYHPGTALETGLDGGTRSQVMPRTGVSDDPSSPDFDEPPGVQADDPPDIAEGRRNGTIPANAVVEVTEPEEEGEWVETAGCDPADLPPPRELTDEEWLETLPIRAKLPEHIRKRFDAEALASRAFDPIRDEVYEKSKGIRKTLDSRNKGHQGPWRYKLRSFLEMNDPSRWLICDVCDGTGEVPIFGGMCGKCHRDGYRIS